MPLPFQQIDIPPGSGIPGGWVGVIIATGGVIGPLVAALAVRWRKGPSRAMIRLRRQHEDCLRRGAVMQATIDSQGQQIALLERQVELLITGKGRNRGANPA